jgi:hypothetical protein
MKTTVTSVAIILLLASLVQAQPQIPTDRHYPVPVENQSFFFQPSQVSPYQLGVFGDVMGQFSDHPLSEINRNPAYLNRFNERSYVYVDVKTLADETLESYSTGCPFCITPGWIIMPIEENRTLREPFLSTAFFMNPFEDSGWRFGLTYQLMSMSEPFYQLRRFSSSIYYPQLGFYSGLPSPPAYTGERDQYRLQGHFPSFYTGYEFSGRLSAGLKVSYNYYSAAGSQISENFGNISGLTIPPQANEFSRQRDVTYSHWDFSAGIQAGLGDQSTLGISLGYLTGAFDQESSEIYNQAYETYDLNGDDDYYTNFNNMNERSGFDRTGQTLYASADYEYKREGFSSFALNYRISRSDQDFDFGALSNQRYEFESYSVNSAGEAQLSKTENEYTTRNTGTGSSELWQHRFSASYSRDLTNNFRLRSGFQIHFDIDKESFADLQRRDNVHYSYNETDGETTQDRIYRSDYRHLNSMMPANYRFTGYLPVMLGRSFGQHIYAELGVMGFYRSEIRRLDQIVDYDNRYEVIEGGEVVESDATQTRSESDQRRRHSSTMMNAFSSISIMPNDQLRIRLMTYSDRREINRVSSVDAIRFQISAEIGF